MTVLNDPSTYEILNPEDFGLKRYVHFTSRLTGWNAIKSRCEQLGMTMTEQEYKQCTAKIKALADIRNLKLDDTDSIIRNFYNSLTNGGSVAEDELITPNETGSIEMAANGKPKPPSAAADLAVNGNGI